jgi:hypothetical protein
MSGWNESTSDGNDDRSGHGTLWRSLESLMSAHGVRSAQARLVGGLYIELESCCGRFLGDNYLIFCLLYGQCTRTTQPDGSRYLWKAYRLKVKLDSVARETIRYRRYSWTLSLAALRTT